MIVATWNGLVGVSAPAYYLPVKTFGQVLESADALSVEEQESLVSILQRRRELVKAVKDARKELKAGRCRPASAGQIMKKILP